MPIASDKSRILICGAGHQGLTMSAHLAFCGVNVMLWNRTAENIKKIAETKEVKISGIINGISKIDHVSSNISEIISDVVMVTTPSSAHQDIARELAPFVHKDMVIILNPGRTFGAIDFANSLIKMGVKELPHIAETQTIIYTCRKNSVDGVTIYALKRGVKIAAIKGSNINYILSRIPECIRGYFTPTESVLSTSLSNVGMILHCAPVLMNIGWIESPDVDFKYYYDGITPSISCFLEKMDSERLEISSAMGCPVESVTEWLKRVYHVEGNSIYECIKNNNYYKEIDAPPTLQCRYIFEDIPNGLVPIEKIGHEFNISTPNISIIIDLANSVMNTNFREIGRSYNMREISQYI